jgi:signal transduction histidine kinase
VELLPIVRAFNNLLDRLSAERQRQQAFVDGVAHELRTPITLIGGYAQRLHRQTPAPLPEPVLRIEAEAARMGRLVADLLDIAREDAGRLELRHEPLDLDDALLEAYERLEPLAAGRLLLHSPLDGQEPLGRGDRERLQQCLTNLVENALKYTPAATPIELFSSREGDRLIAHVRDHGPGIPLAERERIFERFARASSQSSGSGLGLAMVRLLMERMGGGVRVREAPGGGADFQLLLPLADQPAAASSLSMKPTPRTV